jgi:hypothetical protein
MEGTFGTARRYWFRKASCAVDHQEVVVWVDEGRRALLVLMEPEQAD